MDRFAMRFHLGYVDADHEVAILSDQNRIHPLEELRPCATREDVLALRAGLADVRISDELKAYMVELARATRTAPGVLNGASPRASITLMKAAQALARFDEMEFVTPDHIQELAVPVIAHRLMLDSQARLSGITQVGVVESVLRSVAVPA
jgi:MoxR-like ATPase